MNSVLSKPKPITDTYLSLYLEQLQTDGYSIYIIAGDLIQTDADTYLLDKPLPAWYFVEEPEKPRSSRKVSSENDSDFKDAMAESLRNSLQDEQRQLEMAIQMSMQSFEK